MKGWAKYIYSLRALRGWFPMFDETYNCDILRMSYCCAGNQDRPTLRPSRAESTRDIQGQTMLRYLSVLIAVLLVSEVASFAPSYSFSNTSPRFHHVHDSRNVPLSLKVLTSSRLSIQVNFELFEKITVATLLRDRFYVRIASKAWIKTAIEYLVRKGMCDRFRNSGRPNFSRH